MQKVFDRKNKEYKKFFRRIIKNLEKFKNTQLISNSQIHSIINKFNKIGKLNLKDMHRIFEKMWKHFDFSENQETNIIINRLEILLGEFYSKNSKIKDNIFNIMKEIPKHKNKDDEILEKIKEENLRELFHDEDEAILFDLHEYAKEHFELDLCFVSWDDKFIKAVKILLNQLSFKKYIGRYESNKKIE